MILENLCSFAISQYHPYRVQMVYPCEIESTSKRALHSLVNQRLGSMHGLTRHRCVWVHRYMDLGKTALHSSGRSKCLFPRKYAPTLRRFASGQLLHSAFAKAALAGTLDGRDESGGFPSPFVDNKGSNSVIFFPKRRG